MKRSMFPLLLVSAFFLLSPYEVKAAGYSKMCPLSESPLVQLRYDSATDQFVLVDESPKVEGGRNLQDEVVQFGRYLSSHTFRGANRYRLLQSTKTTYTARQCPCDSSGTVYCLVDTAISTSLPDTCGVSQGSLFTVSPYDHNNEGLPFNDTKRENSTIECFELASQTVFIRNAWPVVVLWYGALIIFFLATANGKYAQMCLLNTCCPMLRINERYVDRVLQREEEMRSRLRAAAVRAENDGPGRFLRRSPGIRVRRNLTGGQNDAEEHEMDDPFRRWMEAIETFGMLNAREVEPQQQMEYVLRTRKFDASQERARRNNISETASSALTPIKTQIALDDVGGPSVPDTPETVATNVSEGVDSTASTEPMEAKFGQPADSPLNSDEQLTIDVDEESGDAAQHNHETVEQADDETFDCTICLMEVKDGEQVGVLSCSHIFHVDCLREWIIRRNACPLCQTEISTPRPVEGESLSPRVSFSSEESAIAGGDAEISLADYDYEVRDLRPRPYLIMSSLDRRDPMSDIIASPSRRNRREYNRGRTQRQQREDPFSFAGW